MKLTDEIIHFFHNQGCVIVSTLDKQGFPHSSCKGIVDMDREGKIYLLDLYRRRTLENLKANQHISITAINEYKFIGYCLKGKAEIKPLSNLSPQILKAWEDRITSRLTQRLLRNIRGEKGHSHHPEAMLPKPEYLIGINVEEIVALTPRSINKDG